LLGGYAVQGVSSSGKNSFGTGSGSTTETTASSAG